MRGIPGRRPDRPGRSLDPADPAAHAQNAGEDLIYFDELRWKTWKDKKFATYDDNGKQVVNGLRQVWGQATYHYAWGGDHYWLYPIPYNETQMNPNMEQNPGWK